MSAIDYSQRIPNNVDLAGDRRLQRALEAWQPAFQQWWAELGPARYQDAPVYLRTAVDVGRDGWAHFDHVLMPEYRWGIFLSEPIPDRRVGFGELKGEPVVAGGAGRVPHHAAAPDRRAGRHRAGLRRAAAPAGADRTVAVRPAQPLPDQRRGGPPPLGDGVPAARPLRPQRAGGGRRAAAAPLRPSRQPPDPRRVQRGDAGLAQLLHVHLLHRPRRQVPARCPARVRLRPARPDLRLHAEGGGPPHVRGQQRHQPGGAADRRADARTTTPTTSGPTAGWTCRCCSAT